VTEREAIPEDTQRWLELLPERVVACTAEGRILWLNTLAEFLLGRPRAALEGTSLDELLVGIAAPVLPQLHTRPRGEGIEAQLVHGTGTHIRIELASCGTIDDVTLVVMRPTPPREPIAARARTYELVFEGAPVGIFHFDAQGAVTACNDAFCTILGSPRRVLLGVRIDTLPDPVMKRCMLDTLAGNRAHYEGDYRSATSGRVRSVRVDYAPIFGDDGVVIGGVGIAEDVTERRALEARLSAADRLATVGTLAAGIAHEINNPLAYVMLNLGLLERDPELAPSSRTALERAREGAERVRLIIRDLRIFSRVEDDRRVSIDVREAIDSALNLARGEIAARARLVRETPPVPRVLGDEARLSQVMLNLIMNAAQAIPAGDPHHHTITVRTAQRDSWIEVAISDTGEGIPRDQLAHIFEPFWTTKPVGVGTGLGLSIVHGIVEALCGRIEVESEPGTGSTFRVLLPVGPEPAPERVAPPREATAQAAPASILIIDDERHFAQALRAALQRRHRVDIETSGRAGLARLLRDGASYDLVVCDLMMPDVSGTTILEAVRDAAPELLGRIVIVTGGAYSEEVRGLLEQLSVRVLEKPFEMAELEALIAHARA
jgi:PAS domain S-box-containing protein